MKAKILVAAMFAALVSVGISCKKKESVVVDEPTPAGAMVADTVDIDTATVRTETSGTSDGASSSNNPTRRQNRPEKDTMKDAIVTPPDKTGASLTPGSGRAARENKGTGTGSNASMGSSTGK
jgi:hypothetical protein